MALLKSIDSFLNPKFGLVRNMVPKECHGWSSLFHWNCYFWGGRRYTLHTSFLDRPMFFFPQRPTKSPILLHLYFSVIVCSCKDRCHQCHPLTVAQPLSDFFHLGDLTRTDLGGPGRTWGFRLWVVFQVLQDHRAHPAGWGWNSNFAKKGLEGLRTVGQLKPKRCFERCFSYQYPVVFPSHNSR